MHILFTLRRSLQFATNHQRLGLFWIAAFLGLTVPWVSPFTNLKDFTTTTKECSLSKVHDGDTIHVVCDGERVKVRLYCIDAPELSQTPWGEQSRDYLRQLAGDRVTVRAKTKDRYGRLVAEVLVDGEPLNLAMVRSGHAAVYRRYCEESAYRAAERRVQSEQHGIWQTAGLHQRPWEKRR